MRILSTTTSHLQLVGMAFACAKLSCILPFHTDRVGPPRYSSCAWVLSAQPRRGVEGVKACMADKVAVVAGGNAYGWCAGAPACSDQQARDPRHRVVAVWTCLEANSGAATRRGGPGHPAPLWHHATRVSRSVMRRLQACCGSTDAGSKAIRMVCRCYCLQLPTGQRSSTARCCDPGASRGEFRCRCQTRKAAVTSCGCTCAVYQCKTMITRSCAASIWQRKATASRALSCSTWSMRRRYWQRAGRVILSCCGIS